MLSSSATVAICDGAVVTERERGGLGLICGAEVWRDVVVEASFEMDWRQYLESLRIRKGTPYVEVINGIRPFRGFESGMSMSAA